MARTARQIRDLVIDEISLVDKGANQHAVVTIAKSADGENKENEMDIFDEQGNPLDVADLNEGDVVYDAEGNAYAMELEGEPEQEYEEEEEPQPVGKSFPFGRSQVAKSSSFADQVREELSKALTDKDREEVISKALGQVGALTEQVEIAKAAAENERQLRLEREYTEIAKSYNLPFPDDDLGRVLMHAAEALPPEDCEIIHKAFEVAGEAIFEEYGQMGGGDNADVYQQVEAYLDNQVSKSGGSREEALVDFFGQNPDAYDEYLSER